MTHFCRKFSYSGQQVAFLMVSALQFLLIWRTFFQWRGELSVRIHFRADFRQVMTGRQGIAPPPVRHFGFHLGYLLEN